MSVELIVSDTPDEDDEEANGYDLAPNAAWRELVTSIDDAKYPGLAALGRREYPTVGLVLTDVENAAEDADMGEGPKAIAARILGIIDEFNEESFLHVD